MNKLKHIPDLAQFERSVCDCKQCIAGCQSMPGSLAPGDLENIAEFKGVPPNDEESLLDFLHSHFVASDGTKVIDENGNPMIIPTIVPRQDADARCVFLSEDNRCSIHPVSPYGCRSYTICNTDELSSEDQDRRSLAQVANIIFEKGQRYLALWKSLAERSLYAAPVTVRKRLLAILLHRLEHGEE